jgi:hypothetical protein
MWEYIEFFLKIIGAGAAIIAVLFILGVLVIAIASFFKPRTKDKGCEKCRFYNLNCTEEPCIYCEDGDCYRRKDGQDELE